MLIGPIVFCTVVLGDTAAGDMKVGRVGVKALVYFEAVSTLAACHQSYCRQCHAAGTGRTTPENLDASRVCTPLAAAQCFTVPSCISFRKPFHDAFSGDGDLLQVLLVSILFGYAL